MNYSTLLWAIVVGMQAASIVHFYRWARQLAEREKLNKEILTMLREVQAELEKKQADMAKREKLLPITMHLTVPGPDETAMGVAQMGDLWITSMGRN